MPPGNLHSFRDTTNTLVVGPGDYRFADFLRIGVPFVLICMAASVALVPLVLPF